MNNKIVNICDKENLWAAALYIAGMIYIFPFSNVMLPFIIWSFKSRESDFIAEHGKNVLNFELTIMLLIIVITIPLGVIGFIHPFWLAEFFPSFMIIGWVIFLMAIVLTNLVTMLLGAIKAYQGRAYFIKYNFRFIK